MTAGSVVLIEIAKYVVYAWRFSIAFSLLGVHEQFWLYLVLAPAAGVAAFITITPGALGFRELFVAAAAAAMGAGLRSGLLAATADRAVLLATSIVLGAVGFLVTYPRLRSFPRHGINPRSLLRLRRCSTGTRNTWRGPISARTRSTSRNSNGSVIFSSARRLFIDVGASHGVYTYHANRFLHDADIIAIEADPQRFAVLQQNVEKWSAGSSNRITCINAAVSDAVDTRSGEGIEFFVTGTQISGGLFSVPERSDDYDADEGPGHAAG